MTRVALLDHGDEGAVAATLADGLRELGHAVTVVRAARAPEALLRRRGFTGPLTPIPLATLALLRGDHDVVHAFTPSDALAARLWRRARGGPVVVTVREALDRSTVSDTRLRLPLLQAAVEDADALLAASGAAQAALRRWFALEAPVVDPADAAAHAEVYRRLLHPSPTSV